MTTARIETADAQAHQPTPLGAKGMKSSDGKLAAGKRWALVDLSMKEMLELVDLINAKWKMAAAKDTSRLNLAEAKELANKIKERADHLRESQEQELNRLMEQQSREEAQKQAEEAKKEQAYKRINEMREKKGLPPSGKQVKPGKAKKVGK